MREDLFRDLRPNYPAWPNQPIFGGELPTIDEIGPPDMRPSALNPYNTLQSGAHGRHFAGLGGNMQSADPGIRDYPNELDLLADADDVQGNGVFDPHGTQGNIHPDEGVFADHVDIPGYLVRETYYAPSEVTDATTGNKVMYVPGGAVPIDQQQLDTWRERQLLWEIPPGMSSQPGPAPPDGETWIPHEYSWGIGAEPLPGSDPASLPTEPKSKVPMIAAFAIVGVAVGIFAATIMKR
jgi:hypothetical protein